MIRLSNKSLEDKASWDKCGVVLPQFDRDEIKRNTEENPEWVHFGAGNIFRGFIANAHQKILDMQLCRTGIIAVDSYDYEMLDKVYKPFDDLSVLVTMNANGEFDKKIIASIVDSINANVNDQMAMDKLGSIFESESLQMVSFTITEKGYGLNSPDGKYFGVVASDIEKGPDQAVHTMSIITALLLKRYKKNQAPLTLVSMDNCSHNGDKLKAAVVTIAGEWLAKGFVNDGFLDYLKDESKVAFPISMIDKITPRPSEKVMNYLKDAGIDGMDMIVTSKNTYIAPFVNAESSELLVIEDKFTNGRPKLEEAGVIFTDRETVNKVETMKVTTCLNPLHTALAVSGCLLGYNLIADEMKDPALYSLVNRIGYDEGLKVVVDPGIVDPKVFIDEVVKERFVNPYIPDTPQRIAMDTSQKVAIRFGETIKSYMADENLDVESLEAIPMAIALWCRYLMGVDDQGMSFDLSPDPLMDELQATIKNLTFGSGGGQELKPILSNLSIFGLDLYSVGLGDKIEEIFNQLNSGNGSIRMSLDLIIQEVR